MALPSRTLSAKEGRVRRKRDDQWRGETLAVMGDGRPSTPSSELGEPWRFDTPHGHLVSWFGWKDHLQPDQMENQHKDSTGQDLKLS